MRTRADHEAMMRTPDDWPIWPVLPLKNPTTAKFGLLYGDPRGDTVKFAEGVMFMVKPEDFVDKTITELLDAGWEVD